MVHLAQTVHLSCIKISTISKRTEMSFQLSLVTSKYHWVRQILFMEPMVRLAQTMHLPCTDINTISKRTETRFLTLWYIWRKPCNYLASTLIPSWNRPKRFPSLWYVWCKPCTYLAPTLTLSLNGPKQDSPWPTSPKSSIGCFQNDWWAYGAFVINNVPVLHQD
jgi:hypothetical protein